MNSVNYPEMSDEGCPCGALTVPNSTPKTCSTCAERTCPSSSAQPTTQWRKARLDYLRSTEVNRARRGHGFYPPKSQMGTIPTYDELADTPLNELMVFAHYFVGGNDWWIVSIDNDGIAYGYACLNDPMCAEWGSSYLPELEALRAKPHGSVVERDCYWTPTRVGELDLPGW